VARLAEQVGWNATVIGPRQSFDPAQFDAAVIMTHNFMQDLDLLQVLLPSDVAYVGLLGPKSRGDDLLSKLGLERGRLHNPIGLDLGGETADEIALAIVAEVQAVLNGRPAQPLREAEGPIHELSEGCSAVPR